MDSEMPPRETHMSRGGIVMTRHINVDARNEAVIEVWAQTVVALLHIAIVGHGWQSCWHRGSRQVVRVGISS